MLFHDHFVTVRHTQTTYTEQPADEQPARLTLEYKSNFSLLETKTEEFYHKTLHIHNINITLFFNVYVLSADNFS